MISTKGLSNSPENQNNIEYVASGNSNELVQAEQVLLSNAFRKKKSEPWIGLALSGGGVRSATYCLGAMQALASRGVLSKIDYLSTVSGGGYSGLSFLWFRNLSNQLDEETHAEFPFGVGQNGTATTKNENLDYLRNNISYLIILEILVCGLIL